LTRRNGGSIYFARVIRGSRRDLAPQLDSTMQQRLSPHDLAYCGLFGAAALLLPTLFHLVRLGHVFMPMYLPLVALAFFVRPLPAAVTAALVPLLSALATGMPPLYPPIGPVMSLELAAMTALIAAARRRWPAQHELVLLVPALLLGRVLHVALATAFAVVVELPPAFVAGLSFISGWPGVVLMIAVVPCIVRAADAAGSWTGETAEWPDELR
jgi:hypothetical protein